MANDAGLTFLPRAPPLGGAARGARNPPHSQPWPAVRDKWQKLRMAGFGQQWSQPFARSNTVNRVAASHRTACARVGGISLQTSIFIWSLVTGQRLSTEQSAYWA